MAVGTVHGDEISASVERAQALWREGDTQGALIELKTEVRARPGADDARRVLVGFYREIRHLDQAGRWAIAVDGWTTPLERERLARLIAQSTAARDDLSKFLALPGSPDENRELRDLMAGPVETYIAEYAAKAGASEDDGNEVFFVIMMLGSVVTFFGIVFGLFAVYISTVFEIGDPRGFARFVGLRQRD